MKTNKSLIISVLLFCNIFAQNDPIIEGLDSNIKMKRFHTLVKIQDDSLYQYIPALRERIFNQSLPDLIQEMLITLDYLKAEDIVNLAEQFMIVANNFPPDDPINNPLQSKVEIQNIFFKKNIYTYAPLVFEYINRERNKNHINITVVNLLGEYLLEKPEYEQQAKNELLYIADNDSFYLTRNRALDYLFEKYQNEFANKYLDVFLSEDSLSNRLNALKMLCKIDYQSLDSILRVVIQIDHQWIIKPTLADTLLKKYGKPIDLKTVIHQKEIEKAEIIKPALNYLIKRFIPPRPVLSTTEMINNLINYNTEMYGYGWIRDENQYSIFDVSLNKIKEYYRRPDLENLCREIFMLNDRIETSRNEDKITTEAYKFLHYHLMYIKENVETELGNCSQ
ncbi:hypothetical protein [Ignavibacterium album]|uniref:hypothetical protein n=1 Tax=Ignavibacterium album TaxID=591197 RepID=UPI0035BB77A7